MTDQHDRDHVDSDTQLLLMWAEAGHDMGEDAPPAVKNLTELTLARLEEKRQKQQEKQASVSPDKPSARSSGSRTVH